MTVHSDAAIKAKRWIVGVIVLLMAGEIIFVVLEAQWLNALLMLSIALLILITTVFSDRIVVKIPAEIEVLALVFAFAALFLGEVKSYYH